MSTNSILPFNPKRGLEKNMLEMAKMPGILLREPFSTTLHRVADQDLDALRDPDQFELEFYTSYGKGSFRHRLKTAWAVLWGKNHYLDALCLTPEDGKRMAEFLSAPRGTTSSV